MSLTDAYIRIICDTCGEEEEIELAFVYPDYSGRGGHYDHTNFNLPKGWVALGLSSVVGDKHACQECAIELQTRS